MLESWSKSEKMNARKLFDSAREREYRVLMDEINALHLSSPDEVWELKERLNEKAKEMDERYDYRYSRLIYVFAQLVHAGYLSLEELEVLKEDKVDCIKRFVKGDAYE